MATLLDVLLRKKFGADAEISESLERCIPIRADNVYDYLMNSGRFYPDQSPVEARHHLRDLPNLAPPLRDMFIEFKYTKSDRLGWSVRAFDMTDPHERHVVMSGLRDHGFRAVNPTLLRWLCIMNAHEERTPILGVTLFFGVSPKGRLVPMEAPALTVVGTNQGAPADMPSDTSYLLAVYRIKAGTGEGRMALMNSFGDNNALANLERSAWVVFWTITFMHTKNVLVEDNPPPPKLDSAHMKKYKRPMLAYKTIRVIPVGKKRTAINPVNIGNGLPVAQHIRKGHFKTFTKDKPLLGKHVGTYWWEQTLAGDPRRGQRVNDYNVYPPPPLERKEFE